MAEAAAPDVTAYVLSEDAAAKPDTLRPDRTS